MQQQTNNEGDVITTTTPSSSSSSSSSSSKKRKQSQQVEVQIPPTPTCPLCLFQSPVFFSIQFKRYFFSCPQCSLVFVHPQHHVSPTAEKHRYSTHNNDKLDQRYVNFLMPAVLELIERVTALHGAKFDDIRGLDYGCGPSPTLSYLLKEQGIPHVDDYDPYFYPSSQIDSIVIPFKKEDGPSDIILTQTTTPTDFPSSSQSTTTESTLITDDNLPPLSTIKPLYDFITCTETAEHFYVPYIDWRKLTHTSLLKRNGGVLVVMTSLLYNDEQFENWAYLRDVTHVSLYRPKTMEYIAKDLGLELIWPVERKNIAAFIIR
eukprot:TRINITY_DN3484_c0_g3_i4.p1 TRINITY_DN3484_c0_g3~~TRINITY_DN3484_c0_g3_i4.p1  ORF type:complete len:319 (+),score=72.50 TRINITY_DN3484_c0_g3_i4:160-1116(+)